MSSHAFTDEVQGVLGRAGVVHRPGRTVAVQDVAEVDALDIFLFDISGTEEADFFLYREDDGDFSMGNIIFLHSREAFEDGSYAGFVIAAKDRISFGAENAVFQHRFDALAAFHAVHVGGEGDGGEPRRVAVEGGDEISCIAAVHGAVIVLHNLRSAQSAELLLQVVAHFPLALAGSVHLHQLGEGRFDSFLVDHKNTSFVLI